MIEIIDDTDVTIKDRKKVLEEWYKTEKLIKKHSDSKTAFLHMRIPDTIFNVKDVNG